MRETKTHQIAGYTYQIQQFGGKLGKKVLGHLMRVIAPAFDGGDNPASAFAKALSDEELDYFCENFAKMTQFSADDAPEKVFPLDVQFDNHFAGRYGALVKWLWACVETNYATFLEELGLTPEVRAQFLEQVKAETLGKKTTPPPTSLSGAASLRTSGG